MKWIDEILRPKALMILPFFIVIIDFSAKFGENWGNIWFNTWTASMFLTLVQNINEAGCICFFFGIIWYVKWFINTVNPCKSQIRYSVWNLLHLLWEHLDTGSVLELPRDIRAFVIVLFWFATGRPRTCKGPLTLKRFMYSHIKLKQNSLQAPTRSRPFFNVSSSSWSSTSSKSH